eukprot:1991161-Pleurochrysis_carterae.AAC.5
MSERSCPNHPPAHALRLVERVFWAHQVLSCTWPPPTRRVFTTRSGAIPPRSRTISAHLARTRSTRFASRKDSNRRATSTSRTGPRRVAAAPCAYFFPVQNARLILSSRVRRSHQWNGNALRVRLERSLPAAPRLLCV